MNPARTIYTTAILILAGVFCLPAHARNERAARRILSGWAEVLANCLEEAGVNATDRP